MAIHFLQSKAARTLSLADVFRMQEAEAETAFRKIRWTETQGEPVCPACGGLDAYEYRRPTGLLRFRCKACGKNYSITSGTLFASHKAPFRAYLAAIAVFLNEVKGKNALALSRDLGMSHKARREILDMSTTGTKYCVYSRVSTKAQGESGLGLSGQQAAVKSFAAARQGRIIAEYVEVESGKNNDRPELAKAIARCRKTGAVLLVAKLDRLSRNVAFLMQLRDSGVELAAADMPECNTLMFTVMAGMAQHEREAISGRTKAALAAAKARGVKLGGFRANAPSIGAYQAQGVEALKAKANDNAECLRDDIEPLVKQGLSLRAIAAHLNASEIQTPRKRAWNASGVRNVIARLAIAA